MFNTSNIVIINTSCRSSKLRLKSQGECSCLSYKVYIWTKRKPCCFEAPLNMNINPIIVCARWNETQLPFRRISPSSGFVSPPDSGLSSWTVWRNHGQWEYDLVHERIVYMANKRMANLFKSPVHIVYEVLELQFKENIQFRKNTTCINELTNTSNKCRLYFIYNV